MKGKVYQTIIEMLDDIRNKNKEEFKKIDSTLNNLSKEIEMHKNTFQQLNNKILFLEQTVSDLSQRQLKNNDFKKILSDIFYDFQNMKNKIEKQISLVENKTIILESRLNMGKTKSIDITPLVNSVNEVKDMMSLTIKSMNMKLNEVIKKYEIIESRQNIFERLLDLSTSLDEVSINNNLDELKISVKNLKELDGLDENLQQMIYRYVDSLASYMFSSGHENIANLLKNRISNIV